MDAFTARDVDELLQKRRTAARERAAKRKADAYAADPLLKETDDEIALLKVEKFRAMRNGQPYEQTDKKLAELKEKYIARLAENGLTPEDLEAQYTCPICPPRHGPQVGVLTTQPACAKMSSSPSASACRQMFTVAGMTMQRTSG